MSKFSFQKILDEIQENLANLPISDSIRKKIIEGLLKLKKQKLQPFDCRCNRSRKKLYNQCSFWVRS
jgi:hypothetical protein